MRKTKNITKYNLKWQCVRVSVKGSKVELSDKISTTMNYLVSEKTIDAKERVLNWLEGLQMGYRKKNQEAVDIIDKQIAFVKQIGYDLKEIDDIDIKEIDTKTLQFVYRDLAKRSEKWLVKGYIHKEQESFLDMINDELVLRNCEIAWAEKIKILREAAANMKNTHKFFF
tara:strand:- start:753 stop:1262 length:510 start_codon:yes stop_codon:yes gene_type:complete